MIGVLLWCSFLKRWKENKSDGQAGGVWNARKDDGLINKPNSSAAAKETGTLHSPTIRCCVYYVLYGDRCGRRKINRRINLLAGSEKEE